MIRAAQIGLGWWGKTLVESVQGVSGDMQFVAAASRTQSDDYKAFCAQHGLTFHQTYEQALADPNVDAVVLATPHSLHSPQVIAAAAAGKHVFCEKPFALTKVDAEAAVNATKKAGVTLGLGYNRRFHPEMTKLLEHDPQRRARDGPAYVEATMTFPNGLFLTPSGAWRADKHETPCGALTPHGRARDRRHDRSVRPHCAGLLPELSSVLADVDADDTTSMLFRMRDGMSGYLGTMTATGPGFSFQVFE